MAFKYLQKRYGFSDVSDTHIDILDNPTTYIPFTENACRFWKLQLPTFLWHTIDAKRSMGKERHIFRLAAKPRPERHEKGRRQPGRQAQLRGVQDRYSGGPGHGMRRHTMRGLYEYKCSGASPTQHIYTFYLAAGI